MDVAGADSDQKAVVKKMVMATLISEKHGLTVHQLNGEYTKDVGKPIPYRLFGCSSLEQFCRANPDICKTSWGPDGVMRVEAAPTEANMSILMKVQSQKNAPKRRPMSARGGRGGIVAARRPHSNYVPNRAAAQQFQVFGGAGAPVGGNLANGGAAKPAQATADHRRRYVGGSGRFPSSGRGRGGGGGGGVVVNQRQVPFQGQGQQQQGHQQQQQQQYQRLRTPNLPPPTTNFNHSNFVNSAPMMAMPVASFAESGASNGHGPARPNPNNHQKQQQQQQPNLHQHHHHQQQPSTKHSPNNSNHIQLKQQQQQQTQQQQQQQQMQQQQNKVSFKKILSEFCRINNNCEILEFKTVSLVSPGSKGSKGSGAGGGKGAKQVTRFLSTVELMGAKFSTYPQDYPSEEAAEEAASKKACEKFGIRLKSPPASATSSLQGLVVVGDEHGLLSPKVAAVVAKDNDFGEWVGPAEGGAAAVRSGRRLSEDDVDRIVEVVGNRLNGVWSKQVELDYAKRFRTALPDRWPEMLEEAASPKLRVEKPSPGRFIVIPVVSTTVPPTLPAAATPPATAPSAPTASSSEPRAPTTNSGHSPDHPEPETGEEGPCNGTLAKPTTAAETVPAMPVAKPKPQQPEQGKPPELVLPEDQFWYVFVTWVHSTADVCVRLIGEAYSTLFDDLVTNMELHYFEWEKMPSLAADGPEVGRIYAAKVDGEWHRVEVSAVEGVAVTCYFIDVGDEDVLNSSNLRELDPKFLVLAPQVKHVRAAGLEAFRDVPEAQTELTTLILGQSLVGVVQSNDGEGGIALDFVDTSGDENKDVNLNELLLEKLNKMGLNGDDQGGSSNDADSMPSLEKPSSSSGGLANGGDDTPVSPPGSSLGKAGDSAAVLKEPSGLKSLVPYEVVKPKDFFDVTVVLAGSPSNFTVQPYADSKALALQQGQMNGFYKEKANWRQEPLDLKDDIFFAGMHNDGCWYRVRVVSMMDELTVTVKNVDFGGFSLMEMEKMQPLWPQFRELPMQAINATLADIVPANGDWTPDDTIWFSERVVSKQFVSKIKSMSPSQDGGYKLALSLYDTSNPSQDIVIEKELVDAKMAEYLCV